MAERNGGGVLVMEEGDDTLLTTAQVAKCLGTASLYAVRNLMRQRAFGEVTDTYEDGGRSYPRVRYGGVREYLQSQAQQASREAARLAAERRRERRRLARQRNWSPERQQRQIEAELAVAGLREGTHGKTANADD